MSRLLVRAGAVLGSAAVFALAAVGPAGATTASHALIQGSGSSWAANAVNQWVADVNSQGIKVVYTANGDAQGRLDYSNDISDFAVTSLGYQNTPDPVTGQTDSSSRPYAYLPIAAGGTAFPYQLKVQGKQIRNLRLSGETLTKIFTNQITYWDDKDIAADNNNKITLPHLPITPVVQSEGSGATWQLTKYFDTQYKSIWEGYAHQGATEYFPRSGNQIGQNGSDGAMNYVSSSAANGSIGYIEYSYALAQNYPVVKVQNSAGYYTLPTQSNVAVALEKAVINMDKNSPNYLLQTLTNVYTDPDPRTYPLSSYVYMIIPTSGSDSHMTTAKRQSIADFVYYSICQGQKEIGPIGYSALPVNLVEAGFGQLQRLKTADPRVSLTQRSVTTCNNPTFVAGHPNENYLAKVAPQPPACDKQYADPCADGVTPTGILPVNNPANPAPSTTGTTTGAKSSTSSSSSVGTTAPPQANPGATVPVGARSTAVTTGKSDGSIPPDPSAVGSDPATEQAAADSAGTASATPQIVSAELAGYRSSNLTSIFAPLAAVLLVLVLVVPPVVALRVSRRRSGKRTG